MGLLNHNDTNTQKNKLERGAQVIVSGQVTRDSILSDKTTVTKPVNIRVDNHIRNQISALLNLGYGSSQKDLVSNLVNKAVDELPENEKIRFEKMLTILEQKDAFENQ